MLNQTLHLEGMKKLNKLGVENSLWNNIRASKGSGNKPTKEMLSQEKKIKSKAKKKQYGKDSCLAKKRR